MQERNTYKISIIYVSQRGILHNAYIMGILTFHKILYIFNGESKICVKTLVRIFRYPY